MNSAELGVLNSFVPVVASSADSQGLADTPQPQDGIVSFHSELPEPLQLAMTSFIERYPNWDQYRLIQAAIAGFLVQNGVDSRPVTRLYINNMFGTESLNRC